MIKMGTVNLNLTPDEVTGILSKGKSYVFKDHPYGKAGDKFSINGRKFELIDVCERSLNVISRYYHIMDGYPTSADFVSGWKAAHSGEWDPGAVLYVHWFRDVTVPPTNDLI